MEKSVLKLFLRVNDVEFPVDRNTLNYDTWSLIFKTYRQKTEMPVVIKRLKEKGLIRLVSKYDQLSISLTNKGRLYIRNNFLFVDVLKQISHDKVWDNKWHIVIFDIPESRRKIRNLFRSHLKRIGFIQIQGSVWAYPFQCSEAVTLIKAYFNLTHEVMYIIADFLENDNALKKRFNL